MKRHLNPESMPAPAGPYSHVVHAGDFVFLSGQAPLSPESGVLYHGTFEEEAELVFQNIKAALASVGLEFKDVVKVNAHLNDLNNGPAYNEMYKTYFKEPVPARTTVGSLLGDIKIEIDCIAYKPSNFKNE